MKLDTFLQFLAKLHLVRLKAWKCDHRTRLKGRVGAFSDSSTIEMPLNGTRPDYCLDCLGKMTIRCAWCGGTIFIGEAITLNLPSEKRKPLSDAVQFGSEPAKFVGCLRIGCASSFADAAGMWLPGEDGQGKVERTPTAYEILSGKPIDVVQT